MLQYPGDFGDYWSVKSWCAQLRGVSPTRPNPVPPLPPRRRYVTVDVNGGERGVAGGGPREVGGVRQHDADRSHPVVRGLHHSASRGHGAGHRGPPAPGQSALGVQHAGGELCCGRPRRRRGEAQPSAHTCAPFAQCYGCSGCGTYPKQPSRFTGLQLSAGGGAVPACWEANPKPAKDRQCQEGVKIHSSSRVDITFQ